MLRIRDEFRDMDERHCHNDKLRIRGMSSVVRIRDATRMLRMRGMRSGVWMRDVSGMFRMIEMK
jgi:hypothetical protein